jgi:hypothetical protein
MDMSKLEEKENRLLAYTGNSGSHFPSILSVGAENNLPAASFKSTQIRQSQCTLGAKSGQVFGCPIIHSGLF